MKPEARVLGQALLDHHRARVKAFPPGKRLMPTKYTLRYGDLCRNAGAPHLTRIVGPFLTEIAEWCAAEGWPPLTCLAVGESGLPSQGYDGAGGFKAAEWPVTVESCVRFEGYPPKMP